MLTEEIVKAYCKIRAIDSTIPDEILDFMRDCAIVKLSTPAQPVPVKPEPKDASRNKVMLSNITDQEGIDLVWLKIWEQFEIWYGDHTKKETGRQMLLRIQEQYSTPAPVKAVEDGMRWVSDKPSVFTKDCIVLTASEHKGQWNYNSWLITAIDGEDEEGNPAWYWGLCNINGEELGPMEDMEAELYCVIDLPKEENVKPVAQNQGVEGETITNK
jgi:hypothetical protein